MQPFDRPLEFRQPFRPHACGPLCRITLLRLGGARVHPASGHASHHCGWVVAARILARIGHSVYRLHDQPGSLRLLPELPIQYADFVQWQQQCLATGALAAQLAYWRQHLAELSPLELPTDHPRPRMQTYRGATSIGGAAPGRARTALKALSRAANATLFMTVLAAFKTLLYRYTGQDDIAIGCPIATSPAD